MAIIYSYPLNDDIKPLDELVGTTEKNINGQLKTVTRNFLLADLAEFFIVDGGIQKTIILTTEGDEGPSTLDQVTGILNIPQYAGLQNLQQVTDLGNVTSNSMRVELANNYSQINVSNIGTENTTLSTYAYLRNDGSISTKSGAVESNIKNTSVTNSGVILEFPNKVSGSYTIATTSDVISQNLQQVTDVGATTTNPITANSFIKIGGTSTQFLMGDGSVTIGNGGVYSYEIHVSQVDGNDTTGTGAVLNPVATITKALTLVTGARKTIIIHPGSYTESPSITVQYTVLTTYQATGGNTLINGTVSTSTGCSISGLKMTNLNINAPTGTGNVNILNCDISGTLTRTNTGAYTLIRFCDIGITNINSTSGTVAIFGGNPSFITVNNAGASVLAKNAVCISPVVLVGNATFADCILISTGTTTNALTSSAGTFITLANSQCVIPTFQNVSRVSLSGFYSILNCVFDKPNSTLVALSGTGGSTSSIVYSQFINADKFIKQGGTSSQILAADGSVITAGTNITITGGQISSVGGAGGSGSSVNYYLNGGTSQGTFGGTTYYEFSKTAVIGTGADFSRGSNGLIASFITDVADPSLLLIPAGNWNLEFFFSSSSNGGTPSFYVELYKYDGATFTLIASNSATPDGITGGTAIDAYFTALAVPETILTVNDRLAIRVFVNASSRTITLHTQNGHLCEVITTFTAGLTALNGLQAQVQNFATGTAGTDFDINSSGSTHTFNLPSASATARGVVTTASQTFAGDKTFTGTIGASNLSGTNTGDQNLSGYALLASPTFTGTPSLPTGTTGVTQTAGDNTTKLATTEYVDRQIGLGGPASNILITTNANITTQTTGTSGGISYTQNGRNVMINNGATAITVAATVASTPTDFIASYTKIGTATITFTFTGTGFVFITPNGAVLSGNAGSTALLTKNGSTVYLLINNTF
jgi:hypothetical protein